ncbi:MAG TPA: hypothetical protein VLZ30_03825 [Verrucomicrobiae bacterium]|nr:hypothetical protein [Verrucomicrobiae bacterium]
MIAALETACKTYHTKYGDFPAGDNSAIAAALLGGNSQKIVFLELNSRDMNPKGEVIDPWGTPYRFTLRNGQSPLIGSAGPDRIFDDDDDFLSDASQNQTTKGP